MRTFIDKLIYGATLRMGTEETGMVSLTEEQADTLNRALNAVAYPPPEAPPKDFVKARSLLATSITRLMSRRDVLVQEIEDRSAELFETNRTLEALANAEAAIYEIGKNPAPTEAEVYKAMFPSDVEPDDTTAEEDTVKYLKDMTPEELAEALKPPVRDTFDTVENLVASGDLPDLKATSPGSLLREATAASSDQLTHLDARFRPKGFA